MLILSERKPGRIRGTQSRVYTGAFLCASAAVDDFWRRRILSRIPAEGVLYSDKVVGDQGSVFEHSVTSLKSNHSGYCHSELVTRMSSFFLLEKSSKKKQDSVGWGGPVRRLLLRLIT